jgi:hypothetical protein
MGNDNHALGVERWPDYRVTHFCEFVLDEQRCVVGIVLSGSARPVPVLGDLGEG